jgi:hypothetical protein
MVTVARHPMREIPMPRPVRLEPEAQAFVEKTANPPYLFDLGPEKGRKTVDEVQSTPIDKPDADISQIPWGPGFLVPAASRIQREAAIPTAVG